MPRELSVMKQLHFRISDEVYSSLTEYSVAENRTMQDSMLEAIAYLLANQKSNAAKTKAARFTFIDLFAGIGGMRIAYEANGGRCVFTSEWDRYCQKMYLDNFHELPYGDITQINAEDIPDHDILVAGFPCQPFSIAGVSKKNSLGKATGFLDKTQGTLFFDVARIIEAKRPKAFMLENVKNLKSHDRGNTWRVILETLEQLNYHVSAEVLDGQCYSPQHRERIVIVGFDEKRYGKNIDFSFDLQKPRRKKKLADILNENVDAKYTLSDHLWGYLQDYAAKHRAKGNGFGFGLADVNGVSRTLSARYYKDGSEILIPQENTNPRRLTPRECARLQGFSDSFKITVSDTQAYKQFGNSVVVPLMTEVARLVTEKLKELDSVADGEHLNKLVGYIGDNRYPDIMSN